MSLGMGLLGCGVMGRNHARVIHESGGRLVAVADADPAAARHVADRYGASAHADAEGVLRSPDVEAVVVATPTVHHHATARAALEAGKHVLVEKPITETVEQARDLIALARRKGLVLAVGHVERHNPVVRWAKDRLESGAFGAVASVHARRLSPFPERIRDVGVVLDLAIHDVDVIGHLLGRAPAGVYCLASTHRKDVAVEDHASLLLDFPGGVDAFSETGWLTPTKVRTLALTCENGTVELDYMTQEVTVGRGRFGRIDPDNLFQVPIEFSVERISVKKEEPLRNEHLDFRRAVREGVRPLADGRDGLSALAACRAALESARTRARVALPEASA